MTLKRTQFIIIAILLVPLMATSQLRNIPKDAERWVCTWATSQQLAPSAFPGGTPGRNNPPAKSSSPQPSASPSKPSGGSSSPIMLNMPSNLQDQTVRMIVHTSLGGRQIRVNLSHAQGRPPIHVGLVHVVLHKTGGAIIPGTGRTFLENEGRTSKQ